jgi:hypothetical protein
VKVRSCELEKKEKMEVGKWLNFTTSQLHNFVPLKLEDK